MAASCLDFSSREVFIGGKLNLETPVLSDLEKNIPLLDELNPHASPFIPNSETLIDLNERTTQKSNRLEMPTERNDGNLTSKAFQDNTHAKRKSFDANGRRKKKLRKLKKHFSNDVSISSEAILNDGKYLIRTEGRSFDL